MDQVLNLVLIEDDVIDAEAVRRSCARVQRPLALHHGLTVEIGCTLVQELLDGGNEQVVVLLDLNLPGDDGHECIRRLRADPQTALVPILILSTSDNGGDRRRAFAAGVAGYFLKPIESRMLDRTLLSIHDYWSVSCFPPNDHGYHL